MEGFLHFSIIKKGAKGRYVFTSTKMPISSPDSFTQGFHIHFPIRNYGRWKDIGLRYWQPHYTLRSLIRGSAIWRQFISRREGAWQPRLGVGRNLMGKQILLACRLHQLASHLPLCPKSAQVPDQSNPDPFATFDPLSTPKTNNIYNKRHVLE